MEIRELRPSEANEYRTIRLQALAEWPPAFGSPIEEEEKRTKEEVSDFLEANQDRTLFGAFINSKLIGLVRYSRYSGNNEGHRSYIAGLYVDPNFRQKGAGRLLLKKALKEAENDKRIRRINLMVVSKQKVAIKLYESLGFEKCGTDYEAFSAREQFFDEIMMTKRLVEQ